MSRRDQLTAITLLGVVLVVGLQYWSRAPAPRDGLRDSTRVTLDSLRATRPAFDSAVGARLARVAELERREAELVIVARAAKRRASLDSARADSLARAVTSAVTAADSADLWRQAHDARRREADGERLRADSLQAALDTSQVVRDSLERIAHDALHRLDVVEPKLDELRADLARATAAARTQWYDYIATGCVAGLGGSTCGIGFTIPIGRLRRRS